MYLSLSLSCINLLIITSISLHITSYLHQKINKMYLRAIHSVYLNVSHVTNFMATLARDHLRPKTWQRQHTAIKFENQSEGDV